MKKPSPLALIGCDAPTAAVKSLEALGFSVCNLQRDDRLPVPVRSHADMLVFVMSDTVFTSDVYFQKNQGIFQLIGSYGYKICVCNAPISDEYPNDIAFNAIYAKNCLWGNLPYIAKEIRSFAKDNEIDEIHLNQGYAKCSSLILGYKAVISADEGILKAAEGLDFSTLKIKNSPDAISLLGYNYGFIGGACGVYNNNIYFVGNINTHPFADKILSFCSAQGFNAVSLCNGKLTDVGGIIFIPEI